MTAKTRNEVALAPGRHEVEVAFAPVEQAGEAGGTEGPESTGDALRYQGTVELDAREVVLVTLERDATGRDRLDLRTSLP